MDVRSLPWQRKSGCKNCSSLSFSLQKNALTSSRPSIICVQRIIQYLKSARKGKDDKGIVSAVGGCCFEVIRDGIEVAEVKSKSEN